MCSATLTHLMPHSLSLSHVVVELEPPRRALLWNSSSILFNSCWTALLVRFVVKLDSTSAGSNELPLDEGAEGYLICVVVHDFVLPRAALQPILLSLDSCADAPTGRYVFLVSAIRTSASACRFLAMCNCIAASSIVEPVVFVTSVWKSFMSFCVHQKNVIRRT